MRLLFIPSWFPSEKDLYAGSFIRQLALDLAEKDVKIVVLNFAYGFKNADTEIQKEIINSNLTVYHFFGFQLPKANKLLQNLWVARCFKAFQALSIQDSFQLVHSHDYVGSFLGQHFSEQLNVDHITTMHHSDFIEKAIPQWRVKLLHKMFDKCKYISVPSQALKKSIEEEYGCEVIVVPHYIHWVVKCKKSLPKKPLKAIAVTSLEKVKGNAGLIGYCQANSIEVDIYGGIEKSLLRSLGDGISYCGKLPHDELLERYHEYDFFISYSKVETFGLAALEAMSVGLPILIRNKQGARDLVTDETGMFIEDGSSFEAFRAWYEKYDPDLIAKSVRLMFSKEKVLEKYIKIYESAL